MIAVWLLLSVGCESTALEPVAGRYVLVDFRSVGDCEPVQNSEEFTAENEVDSLTNRSFTFSSSWWGGTAMVGPYLECTRDDPGFDCGLPYLAGGSAYGAWLPGQHMMLTIAYEYAGSGDTGGDSGCASIDRREYAYDP